MNYKNLKIGLLVFGLAVLSASCQRHEYVEPEETVEKEMPEHVKDKIKMDPVKRDSVKVIAYGKRS